MKILKENIKGILAVLMLSISLSISATSKDTLNAVTMVSYEQGWLDRHGTLALKNNTQTDIHNITYRITYLDMQGRALDYEEFSSEIEIAPGMTKKVDIAAYERGRNYSYYLSEAAYDRSHKFKIKFELIGYNTSDESTSEMTSATDYFSLDLFAVSGLTIVIGLLIGVFAIGICVGMYILVAVMANRRNRNAALWVLVSLFATPLLAIIILLFLGEADYQDEDIIR